MRGLLLAALTSLSLNAHAQGGVVGLICETRPTRSCVLDMAAEAAIAVPVQTDMTPPFGRIVETASVMGRLDVALAFSSRLQAGDYIAAAELVSAFARAGRLAELEPWLKSRDESQGYYSGSIVPVLVELGREPEIPAIVAQMEPPPPPELMAHWFILGHLRANRPDKALPIVEGIEGSEDRLTVAILSMETLENSGEAKKARPLLPFLAGAEPRVLALKAELARALGDADIARELLPQLSALPEQDRAAVRRDAAVALAKSGEWRDAVELADEVGADRDFLLAEIGGYSAEPEVFALLEDAIAREADAAGRERLTRMMVTALIRAGFAPVAGAYIGGATNDYERENLLTFAASTLAARGEGQEAMQVLRGIADPHRRAWALWQVANELKE